MSLNNNHFTVYCPQFLTFSKCTPNHGTHSPVINKYWLHSLQSVILFGQLSPSKEPVQEHVHVRRDPCLILPAICYVYNFIIYNNHDRIHSFLWNLLRGKDWLVSVPISSREEEEQTPDFIMLLLITLVFDGSSFIVRLIHLFLKKD